MPKIFSMYSAEPFWYTKPTLLCHQLYTGADNNATTNHTLKHVHPTFDRQLNDQLIISLLCVRHKVQYMHNAYGTLASRDITSLTVRLELQHASRVV